MGRVFYYAKSFEEDFATKTLKEKRKVTFQTVKDILRTGIIKPNTKSFGREMRLSCTVIDKRYTKTYRPQGIIFKTTQKPDYVIPFDLVLLTAGEKIIIHYYRIKNNLNLYYGQSLIPGFKRFIFRDFYTMTEKYPSPQKVWVAVNKFRADQGFNRLPRQKFRLVEYNEAVFHKPIKIEPIALFGYSKGAREIAKRLGLPHYTSVNEFYKKAQARIRPQTTML